MVPAILTPGEVARRVGVHRTTVVNWRKTGRGPEFFLTEGGHARYDARDVARYIEERRVKYVSRKVVR